MTFNELANSILIFPDHKVEIEDAFILSTHAVVEAHKRIVGAKISAGIDLKRDREAARAKKWFQQILVELEEGRINPDRKITFNNYHG